MLEINEKMLEKNLLELCSFFLKNPKYRVYHMNGNEFINIISAHLATTEYNLKKNKDADLLYLAWLSKEYKTRVFLWFLDQPKQKNRFEIKMISLLHQQIQKFVLGCESEDDVREEFIQMFIYYCFVWIAGYCIIHGYNVDISYEKFKEIFYKTSGWNERK